VSYIFSYIVRTQNQLGSHQNLGFSFGSVFTENRGFSFKADPALGTDKFTGWVYHKHDYYITDYYTRLNLKH